MVTQYDVFTKLIEKGTSKESELGFAKPVYAHLENLMEKRWVRKQENAYSPVLSQETKNVFAIIKYSLKNNLNYNLFFSKNISTIIQELSENTPNIRPDKLKGNKDILEILNYLEMHQFILIEMKKPARGILLNHQLLVNILALHSIEHNWYKHSFNIEYSKCLKLKAEPINPFSDKIFAFLAGSAQLEGSTVSIGETRDIILHDIYPQKPQKDIQMVKNLNEALQYILEHFDEKITPEHIKEINKLVLFSMHRHAGKYKITQKKIQGNSHLKLLHQQKLKT